MDPLTEGTGVNPALLNRDYTLIIDRSGSMSDPGMHKKTRWEEAQEGTIAVARKIAEIDPDGITVYTFANRFTRQDNVLADAVAKIFASQEPNGGTNLAGVLADALNNYFTRKAKGTAQPNGETFLIVTDGLPDDQEAVVQEIVKATKKITTSSEISMTFIQVGNDPRAATYLKRLDDDLEKQGAKFDIVDTITIDDLGNKTLTQALTEAIVEHKQQVA